MGNPHIHGLYRLHPTNTPSPTLDTAFLHSNNKYRRTNPYYPYSLVPGMSNRMIVYINMTLETIITLWWIYGGFSGQLCILAEKSPTNFPRTVLRIFPKSISCPFCYTFVPKGNSFQGQCKILFQLSPLYSPTNTHPWHEMYFVLTIQGIHTAPA